MLYLYILACIPIYFVVRWLFVPTYDFKRLRGPQRQPLLGNMLQWMSPDVHDTLLSWTRRYDEKGVGMVAFQVITKPAVIITDPVLAARITQRPGSDDDISVPDKCSFLYEPLFFQGADEECLWSLSAEAATRRRRLYLHAFDVKHADKHYFSIASTLACNLLQYIRIARSKKVYDFDEEALRLGARFASRALYEYDVQYEEVVPAIKACAAEQANRRNPLRGFIFTFLKSDDAYASARGYKELADTWKEVWRVINARPAKQKDGGGVPLWVLMRQLQQHDGSAADEDECIADVAAFFMHTSQSIACTLTFAMLCIASHPLVQQRIHDELKEVGVAQSGGEARIADVKDRLCYLDAVISETLRLYPPQPLGTIRETNKAVVLNGFKLPKATAVVVSPYVLQRSDKLWFEPLKFQPERWFDDNCEVGRRGGIRYMPFLRGSRGCMAEGVARMVVRTVLTTLLSQYRVALAPSTDGGIEHATVLTSVLTLKNGLKISFAPLHKSE